ncbi:hypothetical protein RBH29_07535 [Herbivorax sp. ANBcel31]|uniref:hypothetical protein n=1 Tax=Herbivorax sp. ANBcel31 TaxID=3069754 RepID=UPI0027AE1627|nr:hypothetical protein [Herbivorax sp. ANBcel31]MDQ2086279.1 hypothetical protein [Herbivorax sp. ANBcel31]
MSIDNVSINPENKTTTPEVFYNADKDFYKGAGGELRMKAEALFKKAKEKGISIEDVSIDLVKENKVDFPGIGKLELPIYMVKVKGRDMINGQIIVDGKQIDYYNRYQKYIAQKIEKKNISKEERNNSDYLLTNWEKFKIGKELIEDKEFGLEKTITGACDRIIRKLMGENDWLYPEEARLLDEEFYYVQDSIKKNTKKQLNNVSKKATKRQVEYLKQKLKNAGLNPNDESVLKRIFKEAGFNSLDEISVSDMSKIIEGLNNIIPKVKEPVNKGQKNISEQ